MRGSPGFGELSVAKEAKLDAIALNALGWSGGGEFIDEAFDHEGVVGQPDGAPPAGGEARRRFLSDVVNGEVGEAIGTGGDFHGAVAEGR
jgi:hypothetical protein